MRSRIADGGAGQRSDALVYYEGGVCPISARICARRGAALKGAVGGVGAIDATLKRNTQRHNYACALCEAFFDVDK